MKIALEIKTPSRKMSDGIGFALAISGLTIIRRFPSFIPSASVLNKTIDFIKIASKKKPELCLLRLFL
jgi:hypothetical protein